MDWRCQTYKSVLFDWMLPCLKFLLEVQTLNNTIFGILNLESTMVLARVPDNCDILLNPSHSVSLAMQHMAQNGSNLFFCWQIKKPWLDESNIFYGPRKKWLCRCIEPIFFICCSIGASFSRTWRNFDAFFASLAWPLVRVMGSNPVHLYHKR